MEISGEYPLILYSQATSESNHPYRTRGTSKSSNGLAGWLESPIDRKFGVSHADSEGAAVL